MCHIKPNRDKSMSIEKEDAAASGTVVRWIATYEFFHDLALRIMPGAFDNDDYRIATHAVISEFLERHRCTVMRDSEAKFPVFSCSEEDFLILQLTQPEAIGHSYGAIQRE